MSSGKKYKLLIVDDEYVVIKGLRTTIDWASLDIEIVAECSNGLDALDAIHALRPDLVISDIRMPKLDGLSLARKLREENFDGAVIFYSGYSDFEYARKAIDFGVTKYILKPIENEALISGITETVRELETERSKRAALQKYEMGLPLLRENLVEQYLSGVNPEDAAGKLKIIGVTIPARGIIVDAAVLKGDVREMERLYDGLLESMDGFKAVGQKYADRFVVVSGLTRISVIYNFIKEFLAGSSAKSDCRMSIGISSPYGSGRTIAEAYKQAKSLRGDYMFSTVNNIKTADEKIESKPRKKLVDDALKIIANDYGEKLSIKKIAERLFVSESHLMHEFKENIGKTFTECLTEYRIIKAKELLSDGTYRIGEIAAKVGYSDVRYFGQLFKETAGMSPSEYLDSVKKEER